MLSPTIPDLTGAYDNFLQIWKEQTEDEMHRDQGGHQHEHVHIKLQQKESSPSLYDIAFYTGRNNRELIREDLISASNLVFDDSGAILALDGFGVFPAQEKEPYRLMKCRYFSGFIEYPLPEDPDTVHRLGNLEIHDQGGMVALDYEGVDYTIELTQLIFAHRIKLMKIAIYDLPLEEVGINSKAISYAWSSPESKRLGINIRKLISGWTFIEEGYLSSNNL